MHWTKLIEPFFPKNTRFVIIDTKDIFCIYIQTAEDNKRHTVHRKITIAFTEEAINEYIHNYEPGSPRKADIRLKEFVAAKLTNHKPRYDINDLSEYWLVTTDILNR
jgi:hypothetical protein